MRLLDSGLHQIKVPCQKSSHTAVGNSSGPSSKNLRQLCCAHSQGLEVSFLRNAGVQQEQALFAMPHQVVLEWHVRQPATASDHASAGPQQVSIRQAFQGSARRPSSEQPASDFRILLNKANSCYINSTFMALGQRCQDIPVNGIESVLAEMRVSAGPSPSACTPPLLSDPWQGDGALTAVNMTRRSFSRP